MFAIHATLVPFLEIQCVVSRLGVCGWARAGAAASRRESGNGRMAGRVEIGIQFRFSATKGQRRHLVLLLRLLSFLLLLKGTPLEFRAGLSGWMVRARAARKLERSPACFSLTQRLSLPRDQYINITHFKSCRDAFREAEGFIQG